MCLLFDPDAAALVQAKGSDYSISIQDIIPGSTLGLEIALLAYLPLAVND